MLTEKRNLIRNTALNGLAQSAAMLAAFVFMPLLVESFGLATFGLYVLVSAVTGYAALLDLGVGTALVKEVAEARAKDDRRAMSSAAGTALAFYAVVGVAVFALMAGAAVFAGTIFRVDGDQASILRNLLLVGAAFQLVQWPAATARHVLAGLQRYDVLAGSALLGTALSVAATVAVLAAGEGPVVLVALTGLAAVVASGVNVAAAVRRAGFERALPSGGSRRHLAGMLAFGWGVFVIQLSDVLFYQQTDRLILGVLAGATAVALYEASAKVNALVTYLSGLTVSAVLPLAAGMHAEERHASLRSLFLRGTKYGAALIAPIAVVLTVLAEPLLMAWLGEEFAGQAIVLQLLVLPHALIALGVMGDALVISRGRMGPRVPWILAQAVLNVVLSVILVPRIGVLGVAVGTAVAHLADFPIHIRFLLRETGVRLGPWLRDVAAPVYPLLALPVAVCVLLSRAAPARPLAAVLGIAAAALAAYWVAFAVIGLTRGEREDVAGVARSFFGRDEA